jgi:hypothetical protein
METLEKVKPDLQTDLLKSIGLDGLPRPALKPLNTRTTVTRKYVQLARDIFKGPLVFVQQGIYLTPGKPQGNLKSHLSFFEANMVLTESAAGKYNNMALFGSKQQNGQWMASNGMVQMEFETEDTKTAYLVEFHLNLPNLSGPPMKWDFTLVGYMNGVLSTINHSFSSSQKGNRVLQFFISPSPLRQQFVLLRPNWGNNLYTSTWNFFAVEITAFKN